MLGQPEPAADMLRRARSTIAGSAEADFRGLASTNRQLRLVVAANRLAPSVLAALDPPRVMHYCGHIIAPPGAAGRFPAQEEERVRREIDARLAAGNIGCLTQIAAATALPVVHTVELLDWATGGPKPPALGALAQHS